MAWIESHQELARHPKTARLARLLGVSKPCAIGYLHLFWWWCMDYARDGDLSGFTPDEIADGALWEGDATHLVECLQSAGFVDGDKVHDWHEYAGKLIQRRAADADRKRNSRAGNVHVTSAGHPQDIQGTAHVPNQPTKPTKPTQPARAILSADETAEYDRKFEEDEAVRAARNAGYEMEEIRAALDGMKHNGTHIERIKPYLLKVLKSNREVVTKHAAPPVVEFVPRRIPD